MADVRRFSVAVSAEEQQFLKDRLRTARFPDTLSNIAPWEDGTDLSYFKVLVVLQTASRRLAQHTVQWYQYCSSSSTPEVVLM